MSTVNPYKTPESELSLPPTGETDRSSVFSPSGRFGRLSYIAWGTLLYVIALLVIGGLMAAGLIDATSERFSVIQIVVSIPLAVAGVLFGIRRLHDINASGWWMLLSLIPIVNLGLAAVLFLRAGSPGDNRFGPPRLTPTWERVVGIIGAALFLLSLLGLVAAIVLPMILGPQMGT